MFDGVWKYVETFLTRYASLRRPRMVTLTWVGNEIIHGISDNNVLMDFHVKASTLSATRCTRTRALSLKVMW